MSRLSPDFEAFLYASIDEDHDAMPVSVLSALARLDIDPWEEAARLAAIPKCNAARRLVHIMASIPETSLEQRNIEELATRLVNLLPDRGGIRHYELPEGFPSVKTTGLRVSFLTGMLLGMQWVATSCQPLNQRDASFTPPAVTNSSTAPFDGIRR
jgi:hypothetical protein